MSADTDLDLILASGADTFAAGGVTVQTDLMENDAVMGETPAAAGVILGSGYVLVRASLFPTLATNSLVTLNGTSYRVAQKLRIQDGRVLQVYLGDPNA